MGNHAEQIKGVGVVWPGDEDPTVQLRCPIQVAALVLLQRQSQVIRHGKLRVDAAAVGATTAPNRHRRYRKMLLKSSLLESVLLMMWASVKASKLSVPPAR